jgi:hypothetical protein
MIKMEIYRQLGNGEYERDFVTIDRCKFLRDYEEFPDLKREGDVHGYT